MTLEPDDWSKGHAKIVVAAVTEIDFVAELESQAHWPDCGLQTASWINSGVQAGCSETENVADDRAAGKNVAQQTGAEPKIHESSFHGHKWTEPAVRLQLYSEQTVSYADRRVLDRDKISIHDVAERLIYIHSVVVGHLALRHNAVVHTKTEASADSEVVRARLRDAQVIEEDPRFNTLLR